MGIEPTCSAWKADILPLNYTCEGQTFLNQLFKYNMKIRVCQAVFRKNCKNRGKSPRQG